MSNKFKWIVSGIVILIVLLVGLKIIQYTGYTGLYYPDREYQELLEEKRYLDLKSSDEYYPSELTKLYLLGPIDYSMKLDVDPDSYIQNIWTVKEDEAETSALIISFTGNFTNNIKENNDSYEWMLRGLIETLKVNTDIERIYILYEGNYIDAYLGRWNINYPVLVE